MALDKNANAAEGVKGVEGRDALTAAVENLLGAISLDATGAASFSGDPIPRGKVEWTARAGVVTVTIVNGFASFGYPKPFAGGVLVVVTGGGTNHVLPYATSKTILTVKGSPGVEQVKYLAVGW